MCYSSADSAKVASGFQVTTIPPAPEIPETECCPLLEIKAIVLAGCPGLPKALNPVNTSSTPAA